MKDAAGLLDAVVEWLGLPRFDFTRLEVYEDALGREQLLEPGLWGRVWAFYQRHNARMVRRHSPAPLLASTRAALDEFYRAPNRALDALLRAAPGVAVFPPRAGDASLLPASWSS